MSFAFVWSDPPGTETAPDSPIEVNQEDIFSFSISQSEGDFASMEIEIINPKIGLLNPSRQLWAYLLYNGNPLFFGRLIGIPKNIFSEIVTLQFVARPQNYEDLKSELADSLKVQPYWDTLFIPFEEQDNADRVLDARTALWHVDRTTLDVSISDIVSGEDGTIVYDGSTVFYDSVDFSYDQIPARKILVNAEIGWQQSGNGTVNITQDLLNGFANVTTTSIEDFKKATKEAFAKNMINVMGGKGFIDAWPTQGTSLGGGWSVGRSTIKYVGEEPDGDLIVASSGIEDAEAADLIDVFNGAGILLQVLKDWSPSRQPFFGDRHYVWLPIVPVAPFMELNWTASREYTESINFELSADVQNVLTSEDESEIINLNVRSARVDEAVDNGSMPISNVLRSSYFSTDRGIQSVEYLISLARSHLVARARSAKITFGTTFDSVIDATCRKSATLVDSRLPGGTATGKIVEYQLAFNAESGEKDGSITIACAVGLDGSLSGSTGTPVYVESDYEDDSYQIYSGSTTALHSGSVTYDKDSLYIAPNDDGINMQLIDRSFVQSVIVTGGLDEQIDKTTNNKSTYRYKAFGEIERVDPVYDSVKAAQKAINSISTDVVVTMTPLSGGPFRTTYNLNVSNLKIPKMIDLQ